MSETNPDIDIVTVSEIEIKQIEEKVEEPVRPEG